VLESDREIRALLDLAVFDGTAEQLGNARGVSPAVRLLLALQIGPWH